MCLLCCGRTLAAYAVDNDIVGMNGAHRDHHSLHVFRRATPMYSTYTKYSKRWRLCLEQTGIYTVHIGLVGIIMI